MIKGRSPHRELGPGSCRAQGQVFQHFELLKVSAPESTEIEGERVPRWFLVSACPQT